MNSRLAFICAAWLAVGLLASGCQGEPPESLAATSVQWWTFTDPALGASISMPLKYRLERGWDSSGALFRHEGYPVLMLSLLDENTARNRGLWAAHRPLSVATVGGAPAQHYAYRHFDGPFYMDTLSWVVEWKGGFFEVAVRTDRGELDEVQGRILASLQLIDDIKG